MNRLNPLLAALLLAAMSLTAVTGVHAADTAPAPAAAADSLAGARALIADNKWVAAIEELKRVDAKDNADWNNLMGYALRKQTPPDLDAAQRHYDAALRIDPQHRGALEYSGELFLMIGDLPRA